ncbi:MAG: phospholipase D-like domain-containing protein [Solirubrobacterales bacterium]
MPTWLVIVVTAGASYLLSLVVRVLTSREKKIAHEIEHLFSVADDQFVRSMGGLLPPAVLGGNRITSLTNGDEFFPAMLNAIGSARHSVTFETYIYWQGEIGRQFADALIDRARAGVRVHVLLDWIGTKKMDPQLVQSLKDAGAEVERYHPLRWYNIRRVNNRTHRKLLVVDGTVGFTGGAGIADQWLGCAQDPDHWRDSHFKIEGPVVAQCQAAFMDNWLKTRSRVLQSREYFPEVAPAGSHRAQVFMSSPSEGSESARLMYLLSIASATESIRIASAYFVPDDLSVRTLVDARRRGVTVEIIVPGEHTDTDVIRRAGRSRWGPLLEAGAAIYEYRPTMYHCKVMIVDDRWTSVGSANFDSRSFRLNDEANLNVYDADFAHEQADVFDRDKEQSRRVTLEEWRDRPWPEKLHEWLTGLVRSQL